MNGEIINRTFVDSYIDLTGKRVRGCEFDGCIVNLDRDEKTDINGIILMSCLKTGSGWPQPFVDVVLRAKGGGGYYDGV